MNSLAVGIVLAFAVGYLAVMAVLAKRGTPRPETAFLVAFTALSLLCLVALPGFSTADEAHHFLRAYGISQGAWVEDELNPDSDILSGGEADAGLLLVGDYFGKGLLPYAPDPPAIDDLTGMAVSDMTLSDVARTWETRVSDEPFFYGFANTALYSPVSYLPQALAIGAVDTVTDRPWIMYYAARLAMIAAYGALVFAAIRMIPRGKHLLAVIALSPRAIAEANSVGADAFVIALCVLLIALVLKFRDEGKRLSGANIAALCTICACVALSKIVYLPIVFSILLVPPRQYRETGGLVVALAIAFGSCALNLGWLSVSMGILHGIPMNEGVDSAAQIATVIADPLRFAWILASTYATEFARLVAGMFGSSYFYGSVHQPIALVIVTCAFVAIAWLFDREGMVLDRSVRIVLACLFCAIVLLTAASLYLQWSEVGSSRIMGLQGRYFLPIVLMLLLAIQPNRPRLKQLASGTPNLAFHATYYLVGAITLYAPLTASLS